MNSSKRDHITKQISALESSIYQFQWKQNQTFIENNYLRQNIHLSTTNKTYIHLKQNLELLYRINLHLKDIISQILQMKSE